MAQEKPHHHCFHHHKDDEKPVNAIAVTETRESTTVMTVEEPTLDHEKKRKEFKSHEQLGELGGAAGAFALFEKHEAEKDPDHALKHKLEEEIAATAAVGAGGNAIHEHHEKKEAEKEEEEAAGKKKP